jgi:hypothetical protein
VYGQKALYKIFGSETLADNQEIEMNNSDNIIKNGDTANNLLGMRIVIFHT